MLREHPEEYSNPEGEYSSRDDRSLVWRYRRGRLRLEKINWLVVM